MSDAPQILDQHGFPTDYKPRKFKAKWSLEAADDLRSLFEPRPDPEPSAVDRLAAIPFHIHRDVATHIAGLPDDLVPAAVKALALGNILKLIPEKHWPSVHGCQIEWEESVIGQIAVATAGERKSVRVDG